VLKALTGWFSWVGISGKRYISEMGMSRFKSMSYSGPFGMAYIPLSESNDLIDDPHTLALIDFTEDMKTSVGNSGFAVFLPQIDGPALCEYWRSAEPVENGRHGGFDWARNSELLFLRKMLPDSSSSEADAEEVYRELIAAMRAEGYPYLVRVWNYLPRINQEDRGCERYQAFCVGRANAMEAFQPIDEASLPAASGLGSMNGGLQVLAIAAREPGIQIENPRQISAFRYPQYYGPRSPLFSRATLKRWLTGEHLYISGTASIVGHTSLHKTLEFQLGETLSNIEALVTQAHRVNDISIHSPDELSLIKVYLRNPDDLAATKAWLDDHLGKSLPRVFLQADVCRSELLVEIEGAYLGEKE
ncbi:chorismate transformation enzyme, FkbO/Hyg5 family, partial [Acidihalobacter prosperus]